jgi:hypothetical protein
VAPVDAPTLSDAGRAVAYLEEISPEMRGCSILSSDGEVLAASGNNERWGETGRDLISAADGAGGVFCVREGGLVAVAVAERFTLASLMLTDLRTALRELATQQGAG